MDPNEFSDVRHFPLRRDTVQTYDEDSSPLSTPEPIEERYSEEGDDSETESEEGEHNEKDIPHDTGQSIPSVKPPVVSVVSSRPANVAA